MESCFQVREKVNTNLVVPESYHFVEGEFDWYEIECSVKAANIKEEYKEELYDVFKKCVEMKLPFELYEHILFTKHGVPLLLIETEKTNNTCLSMELQDYHRKSNLYSFLVFGITMFSLFFGLSILCNKEMTF